jgi:hypothetical protein
MKSMIRSALTLLAAIVLAGVGESSPREIDRAKPAPMPPGRYVLTGGATEALGDDVLELKKDFYLREGQYILSGGPNATDLIKVDDDLQVTSGDKKVFVDDDNIPSRNTRGKEAAKYQGFPIVLVVDASKKLRIVVKDCCESDAAVGELWIHRMDGAKVKLTEGTQRTSAAKLPDTFFDEQYDLLKVFDSPARPRVVTGTVETLPESPAKLLPRFRGK